MLINLCQHSTWWSLTKRHQQDYTNKTTTTNPFFLHKHPTPEENGPSLLLNKSSTYTWKGGKQFRIFLWTKISPTLRDFHGPLGRVWKPSRHLSPVFKLFEPTKPFHHTQISIEQCPPGKVPVLLDIGTVFLLETGNYVFVGSFSVINSLLVSMLLQWHSP